MVAATAKFDPSALDDATRFVKVPSRAVFDEHTERGKDGKLADKFDKDRLQKIADRCNARDKKGQPCPLTLGHTSDSGKESDQPEIVGYARTFRVEKNDKLGRHVLTADFFIEKSRYQEAETYPRVSVERWADNTLDPIALLRRTPARDLGQWTYARSVAEAYGEGTSDGPVWRYAKCGSREVVRYSMGDQPVTLDPRQPQRYEFDEEERDKPEDKPDEEPRDEEPTDEPPAKTGEGAEDDPAGAAGADDGGKGHEDEADGDGLDEEHAGHAMKYADHFMANHPVGRYTKACYDKLSDEEKKQYAAAPAMAGSMNNCAPADGDKPMQHGKKTLADRLAAQAAKKPAPAPDTVEGRLAAVERSNAELRKERDAERAKYARSEASRLVDQFRRKFTIADEDASEMVDELTPLDETGQKKKLAKYARLCEGKADPTEDDWQTPSDDNLHGGRAPTGVMPADERELERATNYMRAHPGTSIEAAVKHVRTPAGLNGAKK